MISFVNDENIAPFRWVSETINTFVGKNYWWDKVFCRGKFSAPDKNSFPLKTIFAKRFILGV